MFFLNITRYLITHAHHRQTNHQLLKNASFLSRKPYNHCSKIMHAAMPSTSVLTILRYPPLANNCARASTVVKRSSTKLVGREKCAVSWAAKARAAFAVYCSLPSICTGNPTIKATGCHRYRSEEHTSELQV